MSKLDEILPGLTKLQRIQLQAHMLHLMNESLSESETVYDAVDLFRKKVNEV